MMLKRPIENDVIIVGAGPIGLAYAIGLKKLNPMLKIIVKEKYEEYQRKHNLNLQHERLAEYMRSIEATNDPTLIKLLERLKKNPFIRTNELEVTLKTLAKRLNINIQIETVEEKEIEQQLFSSKKPPRLIIGADGTHSTVNKCLFPKDNQIKYDFDYVLQLRYEVEGDVRAKPISQPEFLQTMAREGSIANEFVGALDDNKKTPITMQMMISKSEFELLKNATSKNPIKPFKDSEENKSSEFSTSAGSEEFKKIPIHVRHFITTYLKQTFRNCSDNSLKPLKKSISISVNEAPATHAKKIFCKNNNVNIYLGGDAGLGLSYFKGLNAGLESSAQFFKQMAPVIKKGLPKNEISPCLVKYENWFLNSFAPRKINEVASYSTLRIRSLWNIMKAVQHIKDSSYMNYADDETEVIGDALNFLDSDPREKEHTDKWQAYPHRGGDIIKFGQITYVPISYTLNKIEKIFIDTFKPYKSISHQFKQDLKQPLVGLANVAVGIGKFIVGFPTLNPKRIGDGFFTTLRGSIEIVTTPIAWTVKPMIRLLLTAILGSPLIEENRGMVSLKKDGNNYLQKLSTQKDPKLTTKQIHELLAICNDMHRKFKKSKDRGQDTYIQKLDEIRCFNMLRANVNKTGSGEFTINSDSFQEYFSLFTNKSSDVAEVVPSKEIANVSTKLSSW